MNLNGAYHRTVEPEKLMQIVDATAAAIKEWNAAREVPITHIVCSGSSGQAVAWPVSYKLGIPVCIVRKPDEKSHAGLISGAGRLCSYIIVDDLIDSGSTIRRIIGAIGERAASQGCEVGAEPKVAAIFLYQPTDSPPSRSEFEGTPIVNTGAIL